MFNVYLSGQKSSICVSPKQIKSSKQKYGKTRLGDRVYQKAPPIGGTFGEVSESLRLLAPRDGRARE